MGGRNVSVFQHSQQDQGRGALHYSDGFSGQALQAARIPHRSEHVLHAPRTAHRSQQQYLGDGRGRALGIQAQQPGGGPGRMGGGIKVRLE